MIRAKGKRPAISLASLSRCGSIGVYRWGTFRCWGRGVSEAGPFAEQRSVFGYGTWQIVMVVRVAFG